jgi:hypothetical protein
LSMQIREDIYIGHLIDVSEIVFRTVTTVGSWEDGG